MYPIFGASYSVSIGPGEDQSLVGVAIDNYLKRDYAQVLLHVVLIFEIHFSFFLISSSVLAELRDVLSYNTLG